MGDWHIVPGDVEKVLTSVAGSQEDLAKAFDEETVTGMFEGVSWGGAITNVVPEALGNLMTDQDAKLTSISNHVAAGILGVSNATIAYNEGQIDMAATFQSKGIAAADSGDFSYFEKHGYKE